MHADLDYLITLLNEYLNTFPTPVKQALMEKCQTHINAIIKTLDADNVSTEQTESGPTGDSSS